MKNVKPRDNIDITIGAHATRLTRIASPKIAFF